MHTPGVYNGSRLRVLLVSPLPPPSGGIGRWTLLLLDWLANQPDVAVRLVDPSVRWRAVWDMTLWKRVVGGCLQGVWDAGRTVLQLVVFRPQVVHLCSSAQLRGPWDTVMLGVASLFRVRSMYHLRMGRMPEIMEQKGWEWWGLWGALKLADRVVVLDEKSEAGLKRFLPVERVLRLPNAIGEMPGNSGAAALEEPNVLFMGHVVPEKGLKELMEAWRELRPRGWCLRVAGLGSAAYQEELLGVVGPDAGIEFLGDLSREAAWQQMRAAGIFVLPTHTEGFPNVVLEAMSAGKAILSTRVGAVPEMLDADGREPCGWVVPPRDAGALVSGLRKLLSDENLRDTLGRRALAKVRRAYTTDVVFEQLVGVWQQVAGLHSRSTQRSPAVAGEGVRPDSGRLHSAPTLPAPPNGEVLGQTAAGERTHKAARQSDGQSQIRTYRAARTPWWLDLPWLIGERLLRQIYWNWPALRRWRRRRDRGRVTIQECSRENLLAYLRTIGVNSGALVLLHTRTTGVQIRSLHSPIEGNGHTSSEILLSDILDLVGEDGTLAMPTNAKYQTDALEEGPAGSKVPTYDPLRTLCSVGLVNDFFWRKKGVKRSLFPFNTLAAYGPLADELLQDNLNERKPSPHGLDSGYYRICRRNGLVISIGVPLRECVTIAHVAEEVRPDWRLKDLFIERQYNVVQQRVAKEWTVRVPRQEYDKYCHCRKKMGRDLVAEGVIHEGSVGSVRVDWARAAEIYEFFWRKTARRPYPYYGLWLMRKPWRKANNGHSSVG
jgi:glycosyltransferase involved in cell wall biosynthesis/aminoglycoside N3'-acetyltransferase